MNRTILLELQFKGEVFPLQQEFAAIIARGEICIVYKSIYGDEIFYFSLRQQQF